MKKFLSLLCVISFILLISLASENKPTPIFKNQNVTVALNSIYVYRGIKKANFIITVSGHSIETGNINVRNLYVQYSANGRKHKLNIPKTLIQYKWTYSPNEHIIVVNDDSWDWSRPSKVAFITLELECNNSIVNLTNQTGLW